MTTASSNGRAYIQPGWEMAVRSLQIPGITFAITGPWQDGLI